MSAGYFEGATVDADAYIERPLDSTNVCVVLSEQFGEEAMVVEMEFERIFGC
jgi:hypothetical protein